MWDEAQAAEVMALAASGMPYRVIAERFGTTRAAVAGLVFRQRAKRLREERQRARIPAGPVKAGAATTQGKTKPSAANPPVSAMEVHKIAADIAGLMDFPADKINVIEGEPETFAYGDVGVGSYDVETGQLDLYTQSLLKFPPEIRPKFLAGASAHEMMHHKWETVQKAAETDPAVRAQLDSVLWEKWRELASTDGMTEYSARHWKDLAELAEQGKATQADAELAVNETLAEIARINVQSQLRLEEEGSSIEGLSKEWAELFDTIHSLYDKARKG
jgi:hypothetical protein